jgi:tripartite-type tricarboxylate transporter receptor subunit TctC
MTRLREGIAAILAGTLAMLAAPVHAADASNDYPSKSVRIVVPYPPGGSNDVIARVLAQKLSEQTGQTFIVDNRAGAGGNVGADWVARSEPDGYTLLLTAPPALTTNVFLYKKMPFDPAKAFAPVSLIATVPIVLVVHPSTGIESVGELLQTAKAKPGTLNFGSSGNGSTNHLAGELLKRRAGIDIVHVPYKGAAPALSDLLGGHIPMMFDNIPALMPHVRSGAVTAIGVAGSSRAKALPEVPTVAEAGVDDFEASAWFGLVAPANTPAPVLTRLQQAVRASLESPDVLKRLSELGAEASGVSGDAFGRFLSEETRKWGTIIEESGAKVD